MLRRVVKLLQSSRAAKRLSIAGGTAGAAVAWMHGLYAVAALCGLAGLSPLMLIGLPLGLATFALIAPVIFALGAVIQVADACGFSTSLRGPRVGHAAIVAGASSLVQMVFAAIDRKLGTSLLKLFEEPSDGTTRPPPPVYISSDSDSGSDPESDAHSKSEPESDADTEHSGVFGELGMGFANEEGYLQAVRHIIDSGVWHDNRTSDRTKMVCGLTLRTDLSNGRLPLFTSKFVGYKTVFNELRWFIRGDTHWDFLHEHGVKIWDEDLKRETLDARGFEERKEGELGPGYGKQWRRSGPPGREVDQLKKVVEMLSSEEGRKSRRIIMNSWSAWEIEDMSLPPCHVMAQFIVEDDMYLTCVMTQRSGDMGLGVPYNILSYSFLTHMIAHCTNLTPKELVINIGNAHVYESHIDVLCEQIEYGVQRPMAARISFKTPSGGGFEDLLAFGDDDWDASELDVWRYWDDDKALKPPTRRMPLVVQ